MEYLWLTHHLLNCFYSYERNVKWRLEIFIDLTEDVNSSVPAGGLINILL